MPWITLTRFPIEGAAVLPNQGLNPGYLSRDIQ